jgi:hypothetical protein
MLLIISASPSVLISFMSLDVRYGLENAQRIDTLKLLPPCKPTQLNNVVKIVVVEGESDLMVAVHRFNLAACRIDGSDLGGR